MTNSFTQKLGQGGFGDVYKGILDDGSFVAVKVLNQSKSKDGQDFINEVATISRTSHVNIVTLLGSKRALIYEFMPNGSLENYGMMILEMIGGRWNINVQVNNTSEIYFPHWIYKHLELDENLELKRIVNEEDDNSKLVTNPSNRPIMSRVIEMLEGSVDSLEIPPKPFLYSPSRSPLL
ncbi:hypothetical protein F8388_015108 [Cannabis sativa]|uniref:Protein kinase domain-containing protein n=1 Tax=Cannabis sativa TaxID=3483 RepID=A0A7J6EQZ5_CANSA|nr:hypothetical protein F8388_015108 [Cannabis sativa]KAF4395354.1 hypothetical protein G4B88_010818 [Cannabis sativa]